MSTKVTLYYDQDTHFYTECLDNDHVYMHFNREADPLSVKVRLTIEQVAGFVNMVEIGELRRQSEITDEQIVKHVEDFVNARQKKEDFFSKLTGLLVYGMVDDSVESQIDSGIAHYTKIRDQLKGLIALLDNNVRRGTKLQFGLEELT